MKRMDFLRWMALGFGLFFILFGGLGFFSSLTPNNQLFGLFFVTPIVNILHLILGVAGFWMGLASTLLSRIYFQSIGFIYALITILGFACSEKACYSILANTITDTWTNLLIAILSLCIGFWIKSKK